MGLATNLEKANMLHSLRVRLLAVMGLVGLVAITTVAFTAIRSTKTEFQQYLALEDDSEYLASFVHPLIINRIQRYIQQEVEVDFTLEKNKADPSDCLRDPFNCISFDFASLQQGVFQMGQISAARILVTNRGNLVISDSSNELTGEIMGKGAFGDPAGVVVVHTEPFLVYILPFDNASIGVNEQAFIDATNRALLVGGVIAALVAILLALMLSQNILRPIKVMNEAVNQIAAGNLSQQVDISDKGEIGELTRAFNEMAKILETVEQLRRNMVTDVAHELRTPLSNIRGYLEAIQDGVIEPDSTLIASLHEEALQLNRLVDDLQELALAEAGQLNLVYQQVNIQEVVDQSLDMIQPKAAAKQLTIRKQVPDNLPPINADRGRISQILGNLLSNAITHSPVGGEIDVQVKTINSQIETCISNTGPGIEMEDLPFIFERFYRTDRSRSRTTGGAGLGLAIVRQLVKAHGGKIRAESELNKGTRFIFSLPLIK